MYLIESAISFKLLSIFSNASLILFSSSYNILICYIKHIENEDEFAHIPEDSLGEWRIENHKLGSMLTYYKKYRLSSEPPTKLIFIILPKARFVKCFVGKSVKNKQKSRKSAQPRFCSQNHSFPKFCSYNYYITQI